MLQTPFQAKNGTVLYFNLYGIQLSLEEKTYLTAVQNISKQEIAIQNLEAKNRQLTELASDQSHLVRAPLARILAITEVLKEEYHLSEEERNHLIEKIKISAEELDLQIRKISEKMNP
jgi:signal transduction histidine kinase